MKALVAACVLTLIFLSHCPHDKDVRDRDDRLQPMRDDPCLLARGDDECGDE
jgi:hypothetical protein